MKILLLNDNPVVNKLVTLSAQKTSDDLEVVQSIDSISESSYDLVAIDDTVYTPELLAELQDKITFAKSLYICSRNAQEDSNFTRVIKKPFLPTDLVELFSTLGREVNEITLPDNEAMAQEIPDEPTEIEEIDALEEFNLDAEEDLEELGGFEELDLDETEEEDIDLSDDLDISDFDELDDLSDTNEISLDEESSLEDIENDSDDFELSDLDDLLETEDESVLDKDELQEVQNLLDEVNEESLIESDEVPEVDDDDAEEFILESDTDLDEELSLESDLEEELDLGETLEGTESESAEVSEAGDYFEEELRLDSDIESEAQTLEADEPEEEYELENDFSLEEELDFGEELSLETEIENAVGELSQEDLESELDEETLLDMVTSGIDDLDSLNARDLQVAIGEEVTAEAPSELSGNEEVDELEEFGIKSDTDVQEDIGALENLEIKPNNEGVASLKKLLAALSNEDIAASMKGMKISINIELGDGE